MKIVDAHTGRDDLKVGDTFPFFEKYLKILALDEGWLSARVCLVTFNADGTVFNPPHWTPLHVRFTHPRFFLQKVGFIPT